MVLTTHYMDEAQALADQVAVIAAGRVVATGTPDTLGGRDSGETTVRFVLPDGVDLGELPSLRAVPDGEGGSVEFACPMPPPCSTISPGGRWSGARSSEGSPSTGPSLEDVYLSLTGGEPS